jgi:hypothetical protein
VDAAASGAKGVCRAGFRERTSRADERRLNAFVIASAGMHLAGRSWWRRKLRTAKPCGPGARGWREAGGGLQSSQGMPGCFGCTCMLVCAFLSASCTRDRGWPAGAWHSLRPLISGGQTSSKPRVQRAARSWSCAHKWCNVIASSPCFASLAITASRARATFGQNRLLKNLEPFKPYRHGRSAALVIPIRTPATISGLPSRACSAKGG